MVQVNVYAIAKMRFTLFIFITVLTLIWGCSNLNEASSDPFFLYNKGDMLHFGIRENWKDSVIVSDLSLVQHIKPSFSFNTKDSTIYVCESGFNIYMVDATSGKILKQRNILSDINPYYYVNDLDNVNIEILNMCSRVIIISPSDILTLSEDLNQLESPLDTLKDSLDFSEYFERRSVSFSLIEQECTIRFLFKERAYDKDGSILREIFIDTLIVDYPIDDSK